MILGYIGNHQTFCPRDQPHAVEGVAENSLYPGVVSAIEWVGGML